MDDKELNGALQARRRKFVTALVGTVVGGAMAGVGFTMGLPLEGEAATAWGVLAGAGTTIGALSAIVAWLVRPGVATTALEQEPLKRDRLQAQRVWQLWLFPLVTIVFLIQSFFAVQDILAGEAGFGDYISAPLPVLYAWVVAAITMGWDHHSQANRRFMEDELTAVLRARAISAAFVVLMAGATVAFGLGLWRADYGIAALPFVLAAGGATAGIRFAWLDREFGRDG